MSQSTMPNPIICARPHGDLGGLKKKTNCGGCESNYESLCDQEIWPFLARHNQNNIEKGSSIMQIRVLAHRLTCFYFLNKF